MKPPLNLSLDLDNKWSYLKTAGRAAWKEFPSYMPSACQHIADLLGSRGLFATVFVVGQDLLCDQNVEAIGKLVRCGHDVGNHSFHHDPWLHLYDQEKIEYELDRTDELLAQLGARHSLGFRGPGYSDSALVHQLLSRRGYRYCASQMSSCLGPLARAYYFLKTGLKPEQRRGREKLFGSFSDMFGKNRPYRLSVGHPGLWMMPVTVMPVLRTPFHFSYLHYAAERSPALSRIYLRWSLGLCRAFRIEPSLLLHPLDFLGGDEEPELQFFPGMKQAGADKRRRLSHYFDIIQQRHTVHTQGESAALLDGRPYSRLPDAANEGNLASTAAP